MRPHHFITSLLALVFCFHWAAAAHCSGPRHTCDRNEFEKQFYELAKSQTPVSDKVTYHAYETLYGMFIVPLRHATHTPKMLEIGLGCGMETGPSASVNVWRALLPKAELWEAEYDAECAKKSRAEGQLEGIKVVTGDQGDFKVLDAWKDEFGDDFDVIIDDGGHRNSQIGNSFDRLWPLVKLGGVYVIEDLQVGRMADYEDTEGENIMADKIKDWIEQLLTYRGPDLSVVVGAKKKKKAMKRSKLVLEGVTHPIPADVAFVFCQLEACVIGKRNAHTKGAPGNPGHDFPVRVRRYLRGEQVLLNATRLE